MKIINEKGKLFGIINVVDLLVLVAAIAVVAGVGYKLFAKQIKEVASPQVSLPIRRKRIWYSPSRPRFPRARLHRPSVRRRCAQAVHSL